MVSYYRWVVCLVVCGLLMGACAPMPPRDRFAYAGGEFEVTVRGSFTPAEIPGAEATAPAVPAVPAATPREIAATVAFGTPVGDDPAVRDVTIVFTAPDTLAGATVTAVWKAAEGRGGEGTADGAPASEEYTRTVTFSFPSPYGTPAVTATDGALDGLLRFAEALLPLGDVTDITPTDGAGVCTVTRRSADGERVAVFTFSEERALPLRVHVSDPAGVIDLSVSPVP